MFSLKMSPKSCGCSSLFSIFLCSPDWMISNNLSSSSRILSSALLSLMLKLPIQFFSIVIVCFESRVSLYVFDSFFIFVELLILFMHCLLNYLCFLCVLVLFPE
uniref:Putative nuclear body protein n=1 Tax=Ixodes ricinus TaxID=34613 RepID=A0A0K8RD10_IXORI